MKEKGYAYDVVQPQAPALMRHLEGGREAWLELWRQMLWAIPRGGNNVRSRAPFIDLANHRPCGEGAAAWTQLVEFDKGIAKSRFKTEPISGALMLGAQAVNAEGVPFSGRVDHNLLLHFWQLVVLTFVPQVVNKKDAKVERIGYVLAIPDVANLLDFQAEFRDILQNLEAKDPKHTPLKARIDLPAQAGLETFKRLRDVVKMLAMGKAVREWGNCVRAVETYHNRSICASLRNSKSVKLLSFSRVADRPGLVEGVRVGSGRRTATRSVPRRPDAGFAQGASPGTGALPNCSPNIPYSLLPGDRGGDAPRFSHAFRPRREGPYSLPMDQEIQATCRSKEMNDDETSSSISAIMVRQPGRPTMSTGRRPRSSGPRLGRAADRGHGSTRGSERFFPRDPERRLPRETAAGVCDNAFPADCARAMMKTSSRSSPTPMLSVSALLRRQEAGDLDRS